MTLYVLSEPLDKIDGLGDFTPVDLYSIKEIAQNWRCLKSPPIVVRVLCKKRVIHYAKSYKNDKWPLQVLFLHQ